MSSIFVSQERDVRAKLLESIQKYGIKQVDVARETGIHHSTLSLWLQGKSKGNSVKVDDQIENWLINLYSNKPKLAGSTVTRFELLKGGKRDRSSKLNDNFDDNYGFGNLIPININVELEGKKFKEIFFWELNEPYLKLENFAKILVEDNQLPSSFENEIINQMTRQISQYRKFEKIEGEILKVIKLDIRIGDIVVNDQFEWDINNNNNDPEDFSINLCADLGLGSEFILPIAHSIKEQLLEHQKNFMNEKKVYLQMLYNNFNKNSQRKPIEPNTLIRENLGDVNSANNISNDWQPTVKKISIVEIQKFEKKEERKFRYTQRKK